MIGYGNSKGTIFLAVDDENFSRDLTDPFLDPSLGTVFSGYTIQISAESGAGEIIVPQYFKYGNTFQIQNNYIAQGALDLTGATASQLDGISLYIPSYITQIRSGALVGIPDSFVINCQAETKPEGWPQDWTDGGTVNWGVQKDLKTRDITQATGVNEKAFTEGNSFMIGYINESDDRFVKASYPLIVKYSVNKADGTKEERSKELDLIATDFRNNPYDAVGQLGDFSVVVNAELVVDEGESFDYSSFSFDNIFGVKKDPELNTWCCDTSVKYHIQAYKRFEKEININNILEIKFAGAKSFMGYTLVSMEVNKAKDEDGKFYYEIAKADSMQTYENELKEGKYRIRYAIYNFNNSKYRISYMDKGQLVHKELQVLTPLPVSEISKDKGNILSFIVKDTDVGQNFNYKNLRSFQIENFTINMHLWNVSGASIVARTPISVKFGRLDVLPHTETAPQGVNLDVVMILVFVGYAILYAGGTAGLFFFLKEKYKNDEFRRMKPKSYFKTAAIGFVGLGIVILAVLAIIYRFGVFANTIAAFNPSDLLVVFAGIVSLIVIGYFAKYFYGLIKAEKDRRQARKLKLNENVVDDGTK